MYNALLRLSKGKPHAEKMAVVEDVIDVLQLRRVQHQVVGCVERRGIRCAGAHLALQHGSQGLGWLPRVLRASSKQPHVWINLVPLACY